MSGTKTATKDTTKTSTSGSRVDVGDRQFTGPVADNDRDGPKLGNGQLLEHLASGAMAGMNSLMGIPFGPMGMGFGMGA